MPLRKDDTQRALQLLEAYSSRLADPSEKTLKSSVDRLIHVLNSDLFHALLDIQEYYELSLAGEEKLRQLEEQKLKSGKDAKKKASAGPRSEMKVEEPSHALRRAAPQHLADVMALGELEPATEMWNYDEIRLEKGNTGYGMSVAGGYDVPYKDDDASIYVTKVIPGGAAEKDGRLGYEDIIISVNGQSVEYVTHQEAVDAMKNAGNNMALVVRRPRLLDTPQEVEIELVKRPGAGLGFNIIGGVGSEPSGAGQDSGIFITKIIKGSVAEMDGRLHEGDRLMQVNDSSLVDVTHAQAVETLKTAGTTVRLIVLKVPQDGAELMRTSVSSDGPEEHGKSGSRKSGSFGGIFKKKKK